MITLFLDMVETHGRSHRLLNLLVELILPPVRDDFLPSMRSKPYLPTPYSITMCRFRTIAHGPQILHSIQGPQRTPRCQSCSEKDVLETGGVVLRITMLLSSICLTVVQAINILYCVGIDSCRGGCVSLLPANLHRSGHYGLCNFFI